MGRHIVSGFKLSNEFLALTETTDSTAVLGAHNVENQAVACRVAPAMTGNLGPRAHHQTQLADVPGGRGGS